MSDLVEKIEKKEPVVFLSGKRIYMRPVELADAPVLQRYANDPDVRRMVSNQFPHSLISEEEWIKKISKDNTKEVILAIVLKEIDQVIGVMGLHAINWKDRTATTGALIGKEEWRGKGYGTEAKMLLLNHAFNELNLRKISSAALEFNGLSLGFNAKCGYKEEGRQKKHVFVSGGYSDLVLTAVFREDFLPLWQVYKRDHLS
ncbi:MAG: GNAT family protein [Candidatus Zambryskibacteria bacterium]|nr:GNAT family protein [Candidatus Zambryskibacteria bacterium]